MNHANAKEENGGTGNAHKNTTKATQNDTATIIPIHNQKRKKEGVNVLTAKARRNEKKTGITYDLL